jgi:hypothetical protein
MVFWLPGTLVAALLIVLVPTLVRLNQSITERQHFLMEFGGSALVVGSCLGLLSVVVEPFSWLT